MSEKELLAYKIIDHVATKLNIPLEVILKGKQSQTLSPVRAICVFEVKHHTGLINKKIAKIFGCNSHCMVSNRLKRYADLMITSREFKKMVRISKYN